MSARRNPSGIVFVSTRVNAPCLTRTIVCARTFSTSKDDVESPKVRRAFDGGERFERPTVIFAAASDYSADFTDETQCEYAYSTMFDYELTGLRGDGRKKNDPRLVDAKFDVVRDSNGSVNFSIGETEIFARVQGPTSERRRGYAGRGGVVVRLHRDDDSRVSGRDVKAYESQISSILVACVDPTFIPPNSLVYVDARIDRNGGSLFSAALNASVLACVDAGLPLRVFPTCCSTCLFSSGTVFVDPTLQETRDAVSHLWVVAVGRQSDDDSEDDEETMMSGESETESETSMASLGDRGEIFALHTTGSRVPPASLETMLVSAVEGCATLRKTFKDSLIRHVERRTAA